MFITLALLFSLPSHAKDGAATYKTVCNMCHGTGVAGAPKLGDKAAWAERAAKGIEILNRNAIRGFTGKSGYMPPRGGRPTLSDEEVIAAVKFMLES